MNMLVLLDVLLLIYKVFMDISAVMEFITKSLDEVKESVRKYDFFNKDIKNIYEHMQFLSCKKDQCPNLYNNLDNFLYSSIIGEIKGYNDLINLKYFKENISLVLNSIDKKEVDIEDKYKGDLSSLLDEYREALTDLKGFIYNLKSWCLLITYNGELSKNLHKGIMKEIKIFNSDFISELNCIINTKYSFELTTDMKNLQLDSLDIDEMDLQSDQIINGI